MKCLFLLVSVQAEYPWAGPVGPFGPIGPDDKQANGIVSIGIRNQTLEVDKPKPTTTNCNDCTRKEDRLVHFPRGKETYTLCRLACINQQNCKSFGLWTNTNNKGFRNCVLYKEKCQKDTCNFPIGDGYTNEVYNYPEEATEATLSSDECATYARRGHCATEYFKNHCRSSCIKYNHYTLEVTTANGTYAGTKNPIYVQVTAINGSKLESFFNEPLKLFKLNNKQKNARKIQFSLPSAWRQTKVQFSCNKEANECKDAWRIRKISLTEEKPLNNNWRITKIPLKLTGKNCDEWWVGGYIYTNGCGRNTLTFATPVDGNWSPWSSDFTVCSKSCGNGTQTRTRSCTNPKPAHGGKECNHDGSLGLETKICPNHDACPTQPDATGVISKEDKKDIKVPNSGVEEEEGVISEQDVANKDGLSTAVFPVLLLLL